MSVILFIAVFVVVVIAVAVAVAVTASVRARRMRHLEDPLAPRATGPDGARELAEAQVKAARVDGATSYPGGPF